MLAEYLSRYLFEYLLTFPLTPRLARLRAAVADVVWPGVDGVNVQHFHCLDLNRWSQYFTVDNILARPEYVEVEAVLGLVADGVPHPGEVLPVLPVVRHVTRDTRDTLHLVMVSCCAVTLSSWRGNCWGQAGP